jgi:hypothetical protein
MSAATYHVPSSEGVVMVTPQKTRLEETRDDLREIVEELVMLKQMARDGIQTHLSQRELVKHLNPKELAAVARGVYLTEKRSQPIYNRPSN